MMSELAENFSPVVDGTIEFIQRVLARADVVVGGDAVIIEPIIRALENGLANLQGINVVSKEPIGVGLIPHLPQDPYIITTFLLEALDGTLTPQLPG